MASQHLTLIEFIKILLGTGSESIQMRDYFEQDPAAALAEHGLGHLTAEDVRDAAVLLQDNDTVSFDRSYDTGFDWDGGTAGWAWKPAAEGHHDGGHGRHAEHVTTHVSDHHYSYAIDDRDTVVDNSVNQNVDTGGGDFRQDLDIDSVLASGDGAVAAGGDIEDSTVTTGDDNIVGDGNQVVSGDGNTTAFGSGNATSTGDLAADDGSAVAVGGNATGSHDATGSFNETTTTTTTETTVEDSFNVDASQDNDSSFTDDSVTETHVGSHNDVDLA